MKRNIGIIGLYTVIMILWSLGPPLAFIGGTLRETGEKITSYSMGLSYWVNFGFTKVFMMFCTVIILYQAYIIAVQLCKKKMKMPTNRAVHIQCRFKRVRRDISIITAENAI